MHERAYLIAEKSLGTFEEMLADGLMTREQAEKRINGRKNFIHDFLSSAMPFDRFVEYMDHEINFLHTLRQHAGLAKGQVTFILRLLESASRKYFDLPEYWEFCIVFSRENRSAREVSRTYTKAISKHPTNVQLWLGYIDWEHSTRRSSTVCRSLLQQAVRLNEGSIPLWKRFLEFEIEFAVSLQRRRGVLGIEKETEHNAGSIMDGLIAALVLREARRAAHVADSDLEDIRSNFAQQGWPSLKLLEDEIKSRH